MDKKELRKKYLDLRKEIINKEEKSNIIYNELIKLDILDKSNTIGIYSSMSEEVDTLKLIKYCLINKKEVLLPKINKDNTMNFYKIESLSELSSVNKFGIREPISDIKNDNMDLIIVPGVCFDGNLNRVGFGKGFYDKYLQEKDIYKIAICFDEQILRYEYIDIDKYDIAMDLIITDKRKIKSLVK